MPLNATGHPLHTRSLSVTLIQAEPPAVEFAAYVLDLRKRGFAPVGGDLQGTGIIHHMRLDGALDRSTETIARIAAQMPAVAFEATPGTGGESCRDLIGRVAHLSGLSLSEGYTRGLGDEIGGPLGCSHILTLAHLLGPTARWGLSEDTRLHGATPERRSGERIFRRDVTVDGYEQESGQILLTAQLNDLHCAPSPPIARPMERLAVQREITVSATLTVPDLTLTAIDAHERRRTTADLADAQWMSRGERVAPLVGAALRPGVSGTLLRHFGDPGDEAPLREALLMLAPTLIQCFAALDLWTMRAADASAVGESGGYADSCYMWRRDGALQRNRGG
jgi:Protein of unknown function (DUF2889)